MVLSKLGMTNLSEGSRRTMNVSGGRAALGVSRTNNSDFWRVLVEARVFQAGGLDKLLRLLADSLGASHAALFFAPTPGSALACLCSSGPNDEFERLTREMRFRGTDGLQGKVRCTDQPLLVEDLSKQPDFRRGGHGLKQAALIPLRLSETQGTAVLEFFAHESGLELTKAIQAGEVLKIVLQRELLQDDLEEREAGLLTTTRLQERLARASTVEESVLAGLEAIREGFGWSFGAYWEVDEASQTLQPVVFSGRVNAEFEQQTRESRFGRSVGLPGLCWERQEFVLVSDIADLKSFPRLASAKKGGLKSAVVFPVFDHRNRFRAVMEFFLEGELKLSPFRQQTLKLAANLLAGELRLRSLMESARKSSASVNDASERMVEVTRDLLAMAQVTEAEAAHSAEEIDQLVPSMLQSFTEFQATVAGVSRNSQAASALTNRALENAEQVCAASDALSQASRQIEAIVKLISSVAQQTNLLALNATIEAARAGGVGRGFSVVAAEVKALARETSQATDRITVSIGSIREQISQVASGVNGLRNAIEALDEIQRPLGLVIDQQNAAAEVLRSQLSQSSERTASIAKEIRSVGRDARQTARRATEAEAIMTTLGQAAGELRSQLS